MVPAILLGQCYPQAVRSVWRFVDTLTFTILISWWMWCSCSYASLFNGRLREIDYTEASWRATNGDRMDAGVIVDCNYAISIHARHGKNQSVAQHNPSIAYHTALLDIGAIEQFSCASCTVVAGGFQGLVGHPINRLLCVVDGPLHTGLLGDVESEAAVAAISFPRTAINIVPWKPTRSTPPSSSKLVVLASHLCRIPAKELEACVRVNRSIPWKAEKGNTANAINRWQSAQCPLSLQTAPDLRFARGCRIIMQHNVAQVDAETKQRRCRRHDNREEGVTDDCAACTGNKPTAAPQAKHTRRGSHQ